MYVVVGADGTFSVSDLTTFPAGGNQTTQNNLAFGLEFGVQFLANDWRVTLTNFVGGTVTYAIAVELFATP